MNDDPFRHSSRSRCNLHSVSAGTVPLMSPRAHKFGSMAHSLVAKSQMSQLLAGGLIHRCMGQPPAFGNRPADSNSNSNSKSNSNNKSKSKRNSNSNSNGSSSTGSNSCSGEDAGSDLKKSGRQLRHRINGYRMASNVAVFSDVLA